MKHIEVSRKIQLARQVSAEDLKKELIARLGRAIEIDKTGDGVNEFALSGTTGSPDSITRHAKVDVDVSIRFDGNAARMVISGFSRPARSLSVLYGILFFFMLLVGLLPGSIETNAETSGAMDALVFLIFGIYIITDINKKLAEPKEYLETALESLNTTFG